MKITSAIFLKGVTNENNTVKDAIPQVAFIGRSNVGKSSIINALTGTKGLARSSSTPGRTQEANFFLINKNLYLVDLPGYGYAKGQYEKKDQIWDLINWYLIHSGINHRKVILAIDARIGPTDDDMYMLGLLEEHKKDIVILANKVDKLKKNELKKALDLITAKIQNHKIIPFSAEKYIGIGELSSSIFNG